jgi:hypothetical protein
MKFGIVCLKFFFPKNERDRQEVREAVKLANAHAEDLSFTVEKLRNGGLRTPAGLRSFKLTSE